MNSYLYHFSENPDIKQFTPRPVKISVDRPKGFDWLNGSVVWAIDAEHAPLYLFPRECPRIVMMKNKTSTEEDITKYWLDPSKLIVAYVEQNWMERIKATKLYRYSFENEGFINLNDVGMHVTQKAITPKQMVEIGDVFLALEQANVELRVLPDLSSLQNAWDNSLDVSGIRLRNAQNWTRDLFWLRPDADKDN